MTHSVVNPTGDVDDMIAGGAPISQVAACFPKREDALTYFANFQSQKHTRPGVGNRCEFCSDGPREGLLECHWRAVEQPLYLAPLMLTALLVGAHVAGGARVWRFTTHHAVCRDCVRGFYIRRTIAVVLQIVGLLLACSGALVMLAWTMPILFEIANIRDRQSIRFWGVTGVSGIMAGIGLLLVRLWFPLPAPLARIRRSPFNLEIAIPRRSDDQRG